MANAPVPLDTHVMEVALVALDPAVTLTAPELLQVVMSVPAFAVGAGNKVNVLVDTASEQGAFAAAVNVIVTLPNTISSKLGV